SGLGGGVRDVARLSWRPDLDDGGGPEAEACARGKIADRQPVDHDDYAELPAFEPSWGYVPRVSVRRAHGHHSAGRPARITHGPPIPSGSRRSGWAVPGRTQRGSRGLMV